MENTAKPFVKDEAPKKILLDETLAKIATDAASDPQAYLEESRVPEGGE